MKATLTFQVYEMAKDFATAWSRFSKMGYSLSAKTSTGGAILTLYNVQETHRTWINNTVREFTFAQNMPA